jgi:hypothetical protein
LDECVVSRLIGEARTWERDEPMRLWYGTSIIAHWDELHPVAPRYVWYHWHGEGITCLVLED